jgi:alpha-aminoadipic semialdehyde synthase
LDHIIGIRREDKNKWERRVPVVPADMAALIRDRGLQFVVQSSPIRIFRDPEYERAGARVEEALERCGVVLAVKEIPPPLLREGVVYVFFSHTTKGQTYNMDMLRRLLALKCTLIDYERIVDKAGKRLILFGRHAGLAGMIDTLGSLGKRLGHEGLRPNPWAAIKPAHQYADLNAALVHLHQIAGRIAREGLPRSILPLVVGLAGYGNVSTGAQEILDALSAASVEPDELAALHVRKNFDSRKIYKVVFREAHMVAPIEGESAFDLDEYYQHPERYRSRFTPYLPYLTVLMNCIYWDTPYPRLITKAALKEHYAAGSPCRLKAIGDISCDIGGAIEATSRATTPDNPVYVYVPETDRTVDGVAGRGPVIMAVDNLPCEFPRESSEQFSRALTPFLPALAAADYRRPFEHLDLPAAIKNAIIVYQGQFTPDYAFMQAFLN